MEDIPYRELLESLGWTQARAGAFLGVSRQTSNAFATGRRAAPAATLKLLRVVLYCSLTMSREHYNRLVQACGLPDIEAAGIAGANSQQAEA
jgi:transcriptional regulator with XRE-family HTH domain